MSMGNKKISVCAYTDGKTEAYEIREESNMLANFKAQLEKHNQKELAKYNRTKFTDKEFEKIYEEFSLTLDEIGSAMISGDATAKPKMENNRSICDYCTNRAVCRRRK